MAVKQIKLTDIIVADRLRSVDPAHVEILAVSIGATGGVQMPIAVHENKRSKKFELIAGAHRVAAAKQAGLTTIPAEVHRNLNKDQRRLIEIDENVIRHELNAYDRAKFLAERKEVYERLHPETKHGGDRKSSDFKNQNDNLSFWSFSEDAAEKTGLNKRSIERSVSIYQRLSGDVRAMIDGTNLARNQSELIKLSKLEPALQTKVAELVLEPENEISNVAAGQAFATGATPRPAKETSEAKVRKQVDSFERLGKKDQDSVLRLIGTDRLQAFLDAEAKRTERAK